MITLPSSISRRCSDRRSVYCFKRVVPTARQNVLILRDGEWRCALAPVQHGGALDNSLLANYRRDVTFQTENPRLFNLADASARVEEVRRAIESRIDRLSADWFRQHSDEQIAGEVLREMYVEPLEVLSNQVRMLANVPVAADEAGNWCHLNDSFRPSHFRHGVRAVFAIPFTGEANLFQYKPADDWAVEAHGTVNEDHRVVELTLTATDEEFEQKLLLKLNEKLRKINAGVDALRPLIERWNAEIRKQVNEVISQRRQFFGRVEKLPHVLEIPLVAREGRVAYQPISVRRRMVDLRPTREPEEEVQYGISTSGYEQILNVIRHFGRSFEATPKPLANLKEPDIRDVFLGALNVYFVGEAAGERFRRMGKSDVAIEEATRAAFIAEFKILRDRGSVFEALDQIIDYTTWRDSKCAVILISRKFGTFEGHRASIPRWLTDYPFRRSALQQVDASEWRMTISRDDDEKNKKLVHVFAFDMSLPSERTSGRRRRFSVVP